MSRQPLGPKGLDEFVAGQSHLSRAPSSTPTTPAPAAPAAPSDPAPASADDEVRTQLNVVLPIGLVRWLRHRAAGDLTATGTRRSSVSAIVQQALEQLRDRIG